MGINGKPWADEPFPLFPTPGSMVDGKANPSLKIALEMTHAHNLFLRGLNSVYQQGPHVHDPKDAQDLLIFCHAWVISLEHHHEVEETQLFPGLAAVTDDADICAREKEDHKFLHENLGRFEKYVTETKPEVYRWEDLKAVMDAFVPTLRTHLDEEIKSMLALEQVEDKAGLWKVWENTEEAAKAFNHPRVFDMGMPFALGCADKTYEGGKHKDFPPWPFFVPYLINYWYARKFAGAWRFCPYDFWGRPKPLPFCE